MKESQTEFGTYQRYQSLVHDGLTDNSFAQRIVQVFWCHVSILHVRREPASVRAGRRGGGGVAVPLALGRDSLAGASVCRGPSVAAVPPPLPPPIPWHPPRPPFFFFPIAYRTPPPPPLVHLRPLVARALPLFPPPPALGRASRPAGRRRAAPAPPPPTSPHPPTREAARPRRRRPTGRGPAWSPSRRRRHGR